MEGIISRISQYLAYTDYKGTLVSLACSSKTFTEPALDALWKEQCTLVPLIKCMPADLWYESPMGYLEVWSGEDISESDILDDEEGGHLKLMFCRRVTNRDWERFSFYSDRIKNIIWNVHLSDEGRRCTVVDETALRLLSWGRSAHYLLPNVSKIQWTVTTHSLLSVVHAFFGPALKNMNFSMLSDKQLESMLTAAVWQYPLLETLVLAVSYPPAGLHKSVMCALVGLNRLRHLKCGTIPVTQGTFDHLSTLETLETLRLCIPAAVLARFHPARDAFPALKELEVRVEGRTSLKPIVKLVVCRQTLTRLEVFYMSQRDKSPEEVYSLLTFLMQARSINTFTTLMLTDESEPPRYNFILTSHILEPLLYLRGLEVLRILLPFSFDLDDRWLERAARSWPNLRELHLSNFFYVGGRPKITPQGLFELAKRCPKLCTFTLCVDATDPATYPPTDNVVNTKVTCISLCGSPIGQPAQFAAFLCSLFPNLVQVRFRSFDPYYVYVLFLDQLERSNQYSTAHTAVQTIIRRRFGE